MSIWSAVRCWRERRPSHPDLSGEPFLTGLTTSLGCNIVGTQGVAVALFLEKVGWVVGVTLQKRLGTIVGEYIPTVHCVHITNFYYVLRNDALCKAY